MMKSRSNPFLFISAALALGATVHAADLTWNAGLPGDWNTTNTNWSGSTWSNANPDNAIFNNVAGTINLTEAITAGTVTINWNGFNGSTRQPMLTGSSLTTSSLAINGVSLGGGINSIGEAYNNRAAISNTTNVSGDATVTRGMLYVYNGTLTTGGQIKNADAWSVFRSDSSTVTATGGIDFSVLASQVELYGGTVTTPFIKVGNGANWGQGGLTMGSGVTVVATQNTNDFIQVYNNNDINNRAAAGLSAGGMILNTSSYGVRVATVLNGDGGLTKTGSGTLTLNQSNNYTGGTTVSQGTLVLSAAAWTLNNVGGSGVTIGSGATLRADNSVANQLNGLTLNGGTLDAVNSSGNGDWGNFFLTGNVSSTGNSSMNADIALRASNVDFNVASGGTLNVGGTVHGGYQYGNATVSKSGSGTMLISGTNTYTGTTTVSAGTLLVNGQLGTVSVAADAIVGGTGLINGDLSLNATSKLMIVNLADALSVAGTITFGNGFGISNLMGLDWDTLTLDNPYTLISTNQTFDNAGLSNFGFANRVSVGSTGREAYFTNGSLALVVVPEPSVTLLGGLSLLACLRRRRN